MPAATANTIHQLIRSAREEVKRAAAKWSEEMKCWPTEVNEDGAS